MVRAAFSVSDSVVRLESARQASLKLIGQRAGGLFSLDRIGVPLPPACVVSSRVFRAAIFELLPKGHSPSALLQKWGSSGAVERAARARDRLLREGFTWANAVVKALPVEFQSAPALGFVSSPCFSGARVAEEAGLLKTWFWGAKTPADPVVESRELALMNAWALACDDAALRTLHAHGVRELEMAVLVVQLEHAACTTHFFGRLALGSAAFPRRENGNPWSVASGALLRVGEEGLREPTDLARALPEAMPAETCSWLKPSEGGVELTLTLSCFGPNPGEGSVIGCELQVADGADVLSAASKRRELRKRGGLEDFGGSPTPLSGSLVRALKATDSEPQARSSALTLQAGRFQKQLLWLEVEHERLTQEAAPYFAAFRELDLGILPTDAATTTLHETRYHLLSALKLSTFAKRTVLLGSATFDSWLRALLPKELAWAALSAAWAPTSALPFTQACLDARLPLPNWTERWGYLPVGSLDLAEPRWDELWGRSSSSVELPPPSVKGAELGPETASAELLVTARLLRDRELADIERALSRPNRWVFGRSLRSLRSAVSLMADVADQIAKASWMLRRTVLEVDRRLGRLDARLGKGAAFYCTFRELASAVAQTRTDLSEIVLMRSARAMRDSREGVNHFPRLRSSAASPSTSAAPGGPALFSGTGTLAGSVRGRPVLVTQHNFRELSGEMIGVLPEFAPWLALALPHCAGWVVAQFEELSGAWLSAQQLGCPLVALPFVDIVTLLDCTEIEVDPRQGRVCLW